MIGKAFLILYYFGSTLAGSFADVFVINALTIAGSHLVAMGIQGDNTRKTTEVFRQISDAIK